MEELRNIFMQDNDRNYSKIGLDKNITIGIEIESEGYMSQAIYRMRGLIVKRYEDKITGWGSIIDESLINGVEVVSPILTDTTESIEEIYMICSILQKCAQNISERCGGHIHIGADYLKNKESYINLFEIWGNAENIIYKISNESGNIPRAGIQEYACPISHKLNEAIEDETLNLQDEEDLDDFIAKVQHVQKDRYSGLNLLNINNGKNTIEFRISNGSINPNTWVDNIRLFGRIIQVSQKLAEIEKLPEISEEDRRILKLKENLKEDMPEQEKMEILLELLFSEEEKEIYRQRYFTSLKLLEQINDEEKPFNINQFSKVDFKKKKHNLEEFYNIVTNERIDNINQVMRETVQNINTNEERKNKEKDIGGK